MNLNKEACHCRRITYKMILDAINNGASSYEEVQKALGFGSACGKCLDVMPYIVRDFLEESKQS